MIKEEHSPSHLLPYSVPCQTRNTLKKMNSDRKIFARHIRLKSAPKRRSKICWLSFPTFSFFFLTFLHYSCLEFWHHQRTILCSPCFFFLSFLNATRRKRQRKRFCSKARFLCWAMEGGQSLASFFLWKDYIPVIHISKFLYERVTQ